MVDLAAVRQRISEIDAILAAGASSVTLDGLTISWNFEELRKERAELTKKLPEGQPTRQTAYAVRLPSC